MKEEALNLYMILIGCTPKNRFTEQHDIFFGIGASLHEMIPYIEAFWPECEGKFHIDCWKKVTQVGNYSVKIKPKVNSTNAKKHLFFMNLGGYLSDSFEEHHYKELIVAPSASEAIKEIKSSSFYKKYSFKGAASHIDDKYGIDIDDMFNVNDILHPSFKEKYQIELIKNNSLYKDELHIGYLPVSKLSKNHL
jgi:hypothetical protein